MRPAQGRKLREPRRPERRTHPAARIRRQEGVTQRADQGRRRRARIVSPRPSSRATAREPTPATSPRAGAVEARRTRFCSNGTPPNAGFPPGCVSCPRPDRQAPGSSGGQPSRAIRPRPPVDDNSSNVRVRSSCLRGARMSAKVARRDRRARASVNSKCCVRRSNGGSTSGGSGGRKHEHARGPLLLLPSVLQQRCSTRPWESIVHPRRRCRPGACLVASRARRFSRSWNEVAHPSTTIVDAAAEPPRDLRNVPFRMAGTSFSRHLPPASRVGAGGRAVERPSQGAEVWRAPGFWSCRLPAGPENRYPAPPCNPSRPAFFNACFGGRILEPTNSEKWGSGPWYLRLQRRHRSVLPTGLRSCPVGQPLSRHVRGSGRRRAAREPSPKVP